MSKVYQCDRCKTIFEPRVLTHGEPYIARKGKADLDLCPNCYNLFKDFINATSPGRASYVNYHTITVLENIKNRLLPSMTEENEALDKTIRAMMYEPFLADALNKAHAEIKEMDKRIEELIDFDSFVAKEVCDDNFMENADSFAELACRRLVKLGLVQLDGDTYKHVTTYHEEVNNDSKRTNPGIE